MIKHFYQLVNCFGSFNVSGSANKIKVVLQQADTSTDSRFVRIEDSAIGLVFWKFTSQYLRANSDVCEKPFGEVSN